MARAFYSCARVRNAVTGEMRNGELRPAPETAAGFFVGAASHRSRVFAWLTAGLARGLSCKSPVDSLIFTGNAPPGCAKALRRNARQVFRIAHVSPQPAARARKRAA